MIIVISQSQSVVMELHLIKEFKLIQILENEKFIPFADFDKDVWLLNRTTTEPIDNRVINISEITESLLPTATKLPNLLTEILIKYGNLDNYEVLTDNIENYAIKNYVCEVHKIKTVKLT